MRNENPMKKANEIDQLSHAPTVRKIRTGVACLAVGIAALIVWSVVASVDELAKGRGEVQPIGSTQHVESRYGGQLEEILVEKGDSVKKGQVIARFDSVEAASKLDQALGQELVLSLEIESFSSFLGNREADFSELEEGNEKLVREEQRDADLRKAALTSKEQQIEFEMDAKKSSLAAIAVEMPALQSQIDVSQESLVTLKSLSEKGLVRKERLIDAIKEHARFERDEAILKGRRTVLKNELHALERSLTHSHQEVRVAVSHQLLKSEADLDAIQQEIAIYRQRLETTTVTSPIDGIVHSIPDTDRGKVISPGGLIAEIVPENSLYRFAMHLAPKDVGFIRNGQAVIVKVDSFDASRFGVLDGVVEEISPTTLVDRQSGPYYEVQIQLKTQAFLDQPDRFQLRSGMTGEADIVTGSKTLFQYLWKPVYASYSTAFAER
jgi:membrane fusion protein, adhesin transport system